MPAVTETMLPGIRFETKTAPPQETLPRMDISALVGFASCGPPDVPVPVESVGRFREIFGSDLPLAWDPETGRRSRAYLGPAVENFFRNGGRRCWVVRVADAPETNRFVVPGLLDPATGTPALARARCPGAWSDALQTDTVLAETLLGTGVFRTPGVLGPTVSVAGADPGIQPGDLLRLAFPHHLVAYGVAGTTQPAENGAADSIPELPEGPATEVWLTRQYWFRTAPDTAPSGTPATVTLVQGDREYPLTLQTFSREENSYELQIADLARPLPAPGDLLKIGFSVPGEAWLSVGSITRTAGTASPPEGALLITASEALWPLTAAEAMVELEASAACTVTRLTFDLLVRKDLEISARLSRLGFDDTHPRFWGDLPVDSVLFARPGQQAYRENPPAVFHEVADPRFPLAGPESPAPAYIPFGMRPAPDSSRARAAIDREFGPGDPAERLRRDGVGAFQTSVFLDHRVQDRTTRTLNGAMKSLRYEQGKSLAGIHALYDLDEITLLAVPDALHRGWEEAVPATPEILEPPKDFRIERTGSYRALLQWAAGSPPESDLTFEVQEDVAPEFSRPVIIYRGESTRVHLAYQADCERWYYYRLRAVRGRTKSAWSATLALRMPYTAFKACTGRLPAPMINLSYLGSPPSPVLSWSPVSGADAYLLEQAGDPEFLTARVVAQPEESGAPEYSFHPATGQQRISYYRVKAMVESDASRGSPWSNTAYLPNLATGEVANISPARYGAPDSGYRSGLLDLQRALLRFAAVSGRLFAILGFPQHYQVAEIREHLAALQPAYGQSGTGSSGTDPVPELRMDEEKALSFGAVYHPWVGLRLEDSMDSVAFVPPDGLMTGSIAGQAITRGAWQAPANRVLQGVLALDPPFDRAEWRQIYSQQVNLIRQDPRGMLALSARTLSADPDLVPIGARRLMILLCRLALREGTTYVFESNDSRLRRRIEGKFRRLLTDLFQRGAFAGTTAAESFRVITGPSVNTPESIDRGELIVELRVAPSRPLAFLVVKLYQKDFEGLQVEGS